MNLAADGEHLDSPHMAAQDAPTSLPGPREPFDALIDLARQRRAIGALMIAVALLGALLGLDTLLFHLTTDPLE